MEKKSIEELTKIGASIDITILECKMVLQHTGLKKEDLDAFVEYLEEQDTLMPMQGGAKARVEAVRKLMEVR